MRQQFGHAVHASAPGRLELLEDAPRAADRGGVGADELLPSATLPGDQTGPLQHGHVLVHRGEAHRVDVGESRDRRLAACAAVEDVSARGVGQCVEQPVHLHLHLRLARSRYNHLVVPYANRGLPVKARLDAGRARRLGSEF